MKNIILFLMLLCNSSSAQQFQKLYMGHDYLMYKKAVMKINEKASTGFLMSFYRDLAHCDVKYIDRVLYPDFKTNGNTSKDSLINRIFIVDDIVSLSGETITDNSLSSYPIFILRDSANSKVVYFKYDKRDPNEFPFLVWQQTSIANPDPPTKENDICSKISRVKDDFTDEIRISSPYEDITILKYINGSKTVYYLSIKTVGYTVNVSKTGVIILFTDGTKWNKPNEPIDVDAANDGYRYSAFITLSLADIAIFSSKAVSKYRLFIYDQEVDRDKANDFMSFVKCIKTAK